jgi:hypothetical protein
MMNPMQAVNTRRHLLSASSAGFGMLALQGLFGAQSPLVTRRTHFPAKAKRVIFLFMQGGPSQVDTFDFKPALSKQHGKPVAKDSPTVFYQSPWAFKPRGQSGMLVSDLLPNIARQADDLCVINSMHTDHNAHPQAILQMNTGSFAFTRPSVGAWCVYGLGTENQNLPGFITINPEFSGGGPLKHGNAFLPAACGGTPIGHGGGGSATAPEKPLKGIELPFMKNARLKTEEQRKQLDLVQTLNRQKLAADGQRGFGRFDHLRRARLQHAARNAGRDGRDQGERGDAGDVWHRRWKADGSNRPRLFDGAALLRGRRALRAGESLVLG